MGQEERRVSRNPLFKVLGFSSAIGEKYGVGGSGRRWLLVIREIPLCPY